MSNSIRLKKSGVAGKVPQLTDLSISELSYNYADGVLYGKRTSGGLENIVEFAGSENHHLLKHLATPGVPASGYLRFYAKSDDNLYLFTSAGVERKLWHSGNQGSGSGLDADTLDGEHASAFALTNHSHLNYVLKTGDTMTGDLNIEKTDIKTYLRVKHNIDSNTGIQGSMESYSQITGAATFSLSLLTRFGGVSTPNNLVTAFQDTNGEISVHFGNIGISNHIACNYGTFANSLYVFCTSAADHQIWKVPISSFGGGGSGVSSFNGRTGAVTLLKADVEGVLTGNITSHTHSDYVLKAGDTMTGSLNIHKGGQVVTALSLKTTASSNMIVEGLTTTYMTATGSGLFHIRALITYNGDPFECNVAYATVHPDKGFQIIYGGDIYNRVSFITQLTDISNVVNVLCDVGGGITGWAPVSSFGGGGTVSYVGLTAPTDVFYVANSPIQTTGTLALYLQPQVQKTVFAGPVSGGNATPAFRALVATDIPALSYDNYADWNLLLSNGADVRIMKSGSTQSTNYFKGMKLVAGTNVTLSGANDNGYYAVTINSAGGGGSGTVTSVGLSMPNIFSVSGSPVTASGTLTASLNSQTASKVLASPTSASGVPTFRALVANDIPALPYDNYGNWKFQVNNGATSYINKTSGTYGSGYYNGINFITPSGSGITITPSSGLGGNLNLEFVVTGGGSGFTNRGYEIVLANNTTTIGANAWTVVTGMTFPLNAYDEGDWVVIAHITMVKATTTGAVVAMRLIDDNFGTIASTEQYATSIATNRVSMSVSGTFSVKGGMPTTLTLQMWASTTGWYAAATTPSSSGTYATKITMIKLS